MFRDFCNKINLTILNILETQEVKLSYPGQNVYVKENNLVIPVRKKAKPIKKPIKWEENYNE